jgi:NhaC family Na+:H+ antiporter
MSAEEHKDKAAEPPLWAALLPVLCLIGALYLSVVHYAALELTTHLALVIGAVVAALVALGLGHRWEAIEQGMVHGIGLATKACLILLVIGILIGSWIQAGIVPAMIYYGLDLLSPAVFLFAACLICALVSLATGSSWSTAATVGIALIGVGEGLGLSRNKVAGAIISGAYFGDKMSPLSDTTNLAPAMAGSLLFDHIRHMVYTTGPSLAIALAVFTLFGGGQGAPGGQVDEIRRALDGAYWLHWALLLPPLLVVAMVVFRVPALPAILGGSLLGGLLGVWAQGQSMGQVLKVAYGGVQSSTGHKLVDSLLSRGGLSSMFSTVILIVCAMCFGGAMEHAGMLEKLAGGLLQLAHGVGGLVLATLVTCLAMNILGSDQYLAVVVPGRMYRGAYQKLGLAPKNLSRALEDAGTLTSALIPWNTCGAFMIATLGLEPWAYVPFCLLNLTNPLVSAFYGFTGLTMAPLDEPRSGEDTASTDG